MSQIAYTVMMLCLTMLSHIGASLFFAKPRFGKLLTAVIWLAYGALFFVLPAERPTLGFFISLAGHMALFFLTTVGRHEEKGFLFFSYACIYTCFSTLMNILDHAPIGMLLKVLLALCSMALLQVVLYTVLLPAFRKVAPYIRSGWWRFYAVVLGFFALVLAQAVFPARTAMTVKEICVFFLTVLAFCITYTAVLTSMRNMVELSQEKQKQTHTELLLAQVDSQAKEAELVRQNRHDMRHHYQMLLSYARENELGKLMDYLERQTERIEATAIGRFCENETVNNILRVYHQKALEQNIAMQIRAAVKPKLSPSNPELVAVVANILENALHGAAASGSKEPFISVNIRHKEQRLVVLCENACKPQLDFEDMPDTLRGIGIRSITATAEKYNGLCRFSAKNGTFQCMVIWDE